MNELLLLARAPRRGAAAVLARGSLPAAIGLVLLATAVAAVNAARFASDVPVSSVLFGHGDLLRFAAHSAISMVTT